ncbi:MAG: GNAT family N-acetyltransferase [Fimbriimonadaceae bacterium]|nr:GNAT family N-acetyltransferase [Fimbriimonadaceae bacterium]
MSIEIIEADSQNPVLEAVASVFPSEAFADERIIRQVFLDPSFDSGGCLLAMDGTRPVGVAYAVRRRVPQIDAPNDLHRGYITLIGVRADYRERGIGDALLVRAEAYLESKSATEVLIAPYGTGYLLPGVDVDRYSTGLAWLKRHRYEEVYRPISMSCVLSDVEEPAWIAEKTAKLALEGVAFSSNYRRHVSAMLMFTRRHFGDDWEQYVRSAVNEMIKGGPQKRLHAAVTSNGEVIGLAHFDGERFGPIGVASEHRGRSIGQALLYRTLLTQREAGHQASWFLWSDDNTAAKLYADAGFKIVRRFAVLKKSLK